MLPTAQIEEMKILHRSNNREDYQADQEKWSGCLLKLPSKLLELVLDENTEQEGQDEEGE